MKHSCRILFLLSALLFLGAGRASADSLLAYQLNNGPVSVSFELPVMPTVLVSSVFGFEVTPINLLINGSPSGDFLAFFSTADGGGFGACFAGNCLDLLTGGPQLYLGSEAHPTMLPLAGVPLTDLRTGDSAGTISTPEPSGLVLLAFGLFSLALITVPRGLKSLLPVATR
jgi:hypothetical protein